MKKKKRPVGIWIFLIIIALIAGFFGWMAFTAHTVHLKRAVVSIPDLPPGFEGKTILYVSDIDLRRPSDATRAGELVHRLEAAKPDILILGGGYTSPTLTQLLDEKQKVSEEALQARTDFFHYISDFKAPLGRYALDGPSDGNGLFTTLAACGYTLINDEKFLVESGGDRLWLVGVTANSEKARLYGKAFNKEDTVIVACDTPDTFPTLITTEAGNSGHWVDLCLAGGTHGGQIRLFNRTLLTLKPLEQQYISGWSRETGVPMLTSMGLGCRGLYLRLNTVPEVWLIQLTAAALE